MCVFRSIISSIKTQEMKGGRGGGGGVAGGDKQSSQSKPIFARKESLFLPNYARSLQQIQPGVCLRV